MCRGMYIVQWYLSYFYNYEHKIIRKPIFIKKISVAAANLVKDAIFYFNKKYHFIVILCVSHLVNLSLEGIETASLLFQVR